jgi:hypothetical protein
MIWSELLLVRATEYPRTAIRIGIREEILFGVLEPELTASRKNHSAYVPESAGATTYPHARANPAVVADRPLTVDRSNGRLLAHI